LKVAGMKACYFYLVSITNIAILILLIRLIYLCSIIETEYVKSGFLLLLSDWYSATLILIFLFKTIYFGRTLQSSGCGYKVC
jgi:hypothetical protein